MSLALTESLTFDNAYIELGLFGTIAPQNNKRNVFFPGFSESAFSNNMTYQLVIVQPVLQTA